MADSWFSNSNNTSWFDFDNEWVKYTVYFLIFLAIAVIVFLSVYTYFLVGRCYNMFSKKHNIMKCCDIGIQNTFDDEKEFITDFQVVYNGPTEYKNIENVTLTVYSSFLIQTNNEQINDISIISQRGNGQWTLIQRKNDGILEFQLNIGSLKKGDVYGFTTKPALPNSVVLKNMVVKTD